MQGKSATDLQERAKSILGEQGVSEASSMSILDLHRAYSAAYQKLDHAKAEALKDIIVVRTLTFK
jgi:hypothetical protein